MNKVLNKTSCAIPWRTAIELDTYLQVATYPLPVSLHIEEVRKLLLLGKLWTQCRGVSITND